MSRHWRGPRPSQRRPFWRVLLDGAFALVLAVIIIYATDAVKPFDVPSNMSVVDGDSLKDGKEGIRLYGIDAPELAQHCLGSHREDYACGRKAKEALAGLIHGQTVSCRKVDTDRYGRRVSICRAGDTELNEAMVRLGWAIAYRRHSLDYVIAEAQARRDRRGLWQGEFETPEDYRAPRQRRLEGASGVLSAFDWDD
jgi:endonuclease YncB( thermonuclease family)